MNETPGNEALDPDDVFDLSDEQGRQPEEHATRLGVTVQEQAVSFEQAVDYVFQKNSELYGRLAEQSGP